MKVLYIAPRGNEQPWYDDFVAACAPDHVVELCDFDRRFEDQVADAEVIVDLGVPSSQELIEAAHEAGIKLWQLLSAGVDHVDRALFEKKGIPLANTPGACSAVALAEHALFLMLCFAKNLWTNQQHIRSSIFYRPFSVELFGATLGIIGLGASGRELARRASTLGMRILAVDLYPPRELGDEGLVEFLGGPERLDELMAASDYVSIHVPLSESTRNMIDSTRLAVMKPTSVLINVARGAIVNEEDLVEALAAGRVRGAGLDVFCTEPIPGDSPLLGLENVVLTPHVGGASYPTSRRRAEFAAENVRRVGNGLMPLSLLTTH